MTGARKNNGWRAISLLLLTSAAAGLGYLNWYIVRDLSIETSAASPSEPVYSKTPADTGNDILQLAAKPLDQFSETTARPLFNPSRRFLREEIAAPAPPSPPPAPVAERPADLPVPDQARIVGIVKSGNGGGQILVRTATDQSGSWLNIGDDLGGWRLSEIKSDAAVLVSGTQRFELKLYPGEKPPAQR